MELLFNLLKRPFVKRLVILVLLGVLLYLIKEQITLFLLTFILIYLINAAQRGISKLLSKYFKTNRIVVVVFIYLLLAGLLFLLISIFVPEIIREITALVQSVTNFVASYNMSAQSNNAVVQFIIQNVQKVDLQKYVQDGGTLLVNVVSGVSTVSLNILLAIILSLFFLLEKEKIIKFYHGFKDSKLSWLYTELNYFGERFTNSFGKVIQTQVLISFINSLLSLIVLSVMGFPNVFGLFVMIFLLGLVPVAGVIVSTVPLSIIAYTIGGFNYIIIILVLIVVLHALEGYILNPKLMSDKTHMPVFITFIILIMSEHIFGVWGLIVGIPITMFLLDVLDVKMEK